MFIFRQNFVNCIVFSIAFCLFCTSVISQIASDKQPCQLCLITRYMFFVVAAIALFFHRPKVLLPITSLCVVAFTFYHLGVESHWWKAPRGCISELPTLNAIQNGELPNPNNAYCNQINWDIFGISSTLWSFLFATLLFWLSSVTYVVNYCLRKMEDNDD